MSIPPAVGPPPRPPRLFVADDILSGRVNLERYPFSYILIGSSAGRAVAVPFGGRAGINALLDAILSAAEFLESSGGWRLVSVDQGGTIACMRRSGSDPAPRALR